VPRDLAGLGGAVHQAAHAQDVQPAHGPFERADVTSNTYWDWVIHNVFWIYGAQAAAAQFLCDVQGVPAGAAPGAFDLTQAQQSMESIASKSG
jgi:arylsulfatase